MGPPLGSAMGPNDHYVGLVQSAAMAATPAMLVVAALSPSRFCATRLAYAAGLAMFLFAAMYAGAMTAFTKSLVTAGSDFWQYLVSWWYPILIFVGAIACVALFLVGAIRLRHGGSATMARVASWMVLASILVWPIVGILQSFDTFYWLDAASGITWCAVTECAGLAFLRPLGHER